MKVLIDADACPVTDLTISLCVKHNVPCYIVCDTAHEIRNPNAETIVVDKGADSTDFAVANRVNHGDIVITQDYGLASMCLAKGGIVLHQDGWPYNDDNIGALLLQRHENKKYRKSGGHLKGTRKRNRQQDIAFQLALQTLLQG